MKAAREDSGSVSLLSMQGLKKALFRGSFEHRHVNYPAHCQNRKQNQNYWPSVCLPNKKLDSGYSLVSLLRLKQIIKQVSKVAQGHPGEGAGRDSHSPQSVQPLKWLKGLDLDGETCAAGRNVHTVVKWWCQQDEEANVQPHPSCFHFTTDLRRPKEAALLPHR